jgi:transposase-like protein/ribosomal protein L18E
MNIIERGRAFLQSLQELAGCSAWDWKRCPQCGSTLTIKNGSYRRHPWFLEGRETVRVQRHWCRVCSSSYAEQSPLLVGGSWYAREVHRAAVDHWQHVGTSLRRTAEILRSWMGRQERWRLWRPLDDAAGERCYLTASTVQRWLDLAGQVAEASVPGQLQGIAQGEELGTDGLWARLRGKAKRVVLLLADSVTGLLWPPLVARGEESAAPWQRLFERARGAGLDWDRIRGVTSDGAQGIIAFLRQTLAWVQHQRCVWHIWRNLAGDLAQAMTQAAANVASDLADEVRAQVRAELVVLIHGVIDAGSYEQAEVALVALLSHPQGAAIGQFLNQHLDRILVHLVTYYAGLSRVTPEWYWRDFRLRLSRGRNHRSEIRLERAALVWAIYHNFEPAQWRSERKRRYRHPGQSPLQVAGVPPGQVSYLDALGV